MLTWDSLLALAFWAVAWIGFTQYGARMAASHGLMYATGRHRLRWMQAMLERDQRIVDAQIVMTLSRHVLFFAQTSIFVIAGLLASLGAVYHLGALLAEIPFAHRLEPAQAQIKVIVLVGVFIYSFFKFTWSLRLFNYLMVMFGAAPHCAPGTPSPHVEQSARISDLAVSHFNRGLRGYYFGLAILPWFVNPWLLVPATILVIGVLWRREFRSQTLRALQD